MFIWLFSFNFILFYSISQNLILKTFQNIAKLKESTTEYPYQIRSVAQSCPTPWIAAHQASLSITNSQSSLRLTSIESVMPSSHLILCCPLLLLPPITPSIRVFSKESTLCMRWPKYWSFSFSIIPSKEMILPLICLSSVQFREAFQCKLQTLASFPLKNDIKSIYII